MYFSRQLIIIQVCIWSVYALFDHMAHLMVQTNHWQGTIMGSALACVLTTALAYLHKQVKTLSLWQQLPILILAFFVVLLLWFNTTRIWHYHITFSELMDRPIQFLFAGSAYSAALLAAWFGLYLGATYYLRGKEQENELLMIKAQARDAQLQSLRYQLNPHFLFNVLNNIDVAVQDSKNEVAHSMLVKLSRFLRSSLETDSSDKIKLCQELSLLSDFISIEEERFASAFQVQRKINDDCLNCYLPPMLLQPLLENAIKFSWQCPGESSIHLDIAKVENRLQISVENPCIESIQDSKGTGTGLKNIENRLQTLYAGEAQLQVTAKTASFKVVISIPWEQDYAN